MRSWMISLVLVVLILASSVGLWLTWDSTQTPGHPALSQPAEMRPSDVFASNFSGEGLQSPTSSTTSTTIPDQDLSAGCSPDDTPVERDPLLEWATVVIDPGHRLPADFVPPDLVDVATAGFPSNGDLVRQVVIPDLTALRVAAEANGTPVFVASAYRSYEYQGGLYELQVAQVGPEQATTRTARAGHSEHQLGTTVDVLDVGSRDLTAAFADTPAGQWIAAHAHEYGFVLSYPRGGQETVCYDYEPWHLRYVGRDIAAAITGTGLTPRAWMLTEA